MKTMRTRESDAIPSALPKIGGALLDEAGAAVGSMMVVDFASRRDLDAYLEREPYRAEGVWREITVTPMNRVV